MERLARLCLYWAAGMFVVGAVLMVYVPDIYASLVAAAGPNAQVGTDLLDIILTLLRWAIMPTAAALVGAAVVVRAIARHGDGDDLR